MAFNNPKSLFQKLTEVIPLWVILVCLSLTLIGLYLDAKSLVINLVASAIDILITLTVINWFLLRQKRNQWGLVRSNTIQALFGHIGNIASEFMMNFHSTKNYELMTYVSEIGKGYESPCKETVDGLYGIVAMMKRYPKPEDSREQAEKVYKVIQRDINQIQSVLIPRIIAMGTDEPELLRVLSDFENADREWVNQYIMDKEISSGEQYEAAINFMEKLADVYKYVTDHD